MKYRKDLQDYVTFRTAKLLKKAGYPQKACRVYDDEGDILDTFSPVNEDEVAAPHLYDAMKWLRGEKQISVEPAIVLRSRWIALVSKICDGFPDRIKVLRDCPTYETVCDAGIAAACEWLINNQH